MSAPRFAKYMAFVRIGYIQTRAEPAELYGRVAFFAIILGVFSALWRAVAEAGMPMHEHPRTMIWYLALTEWVLLSAPLIQFQIEDDIRRGDVVYQMSRPVSYLVAQLAQGLGSLGARAPVLLVVAVGAAWVFGPGMPDHPERLGGAIGFATLAMFVMTTFNLVIGLLAFWVGDIAPVQWIWQKLSFALGGLMLPLTLYPALVIRLARFTPFPSLLTGPASFVLDQPFMTSAELVFWLAVWLAAAWVAARFVFSRATATLQVNGG